MIEQPAYSQGSNPASLDMQKLNGAGACVGEKWGITSYLNQVNTFAYDKLNRITGSKFLPGSNNAFRTSYSYDSNGNIQKLTRRGSTGTYIDSINYRYKYYTNQLDYTQDYAGDAPGWDFPGTLIGYNLYQYDLNGNLKYNAYKNLNVSYNSFNLPSQLDFGSNRKLNYIYDASGRKLTRISAPGTYYPTNTEYVEQFVHQSRTIFQARPSCNFLHPVQLRELRFLSAFKNIPEKEVKDFRSRSILPLLPTLPLLPLVKNCHHWYL